MRPDASIPSKATQGLTDEADVLARLLLGEFSLPLLVVLNAPLPVLIALEVDAGLLGVRLLAEHLGEPFLFLERRKLLCRGLEFLVLRDEVLAVRSRRRALKIGDAKKET